MMDNRMHIVDDLLAGMGLTPPVSKEQQLKDDLGLDSLNVVELIVALEEALNVEIAIDDLDPDKLLTVADICALADKYGGEAV